MKKYFRNKKIIFILILVLISFSTIFFISVITNKVDRINIKLTLLNKYEGIKDSPQEIFGMISAFVIDKHQYIYIADDAFKLIKKISKEGDLIQQYGFGSGNGPGEFKAIHNLCVDSVGNVYIIDRSNLNINVFDSLNTLIRTFNLSFMPAQIIALKPMTVDVMGFPFTYEGDLIHRYNLYNLESNDPEITYGERPSGIDSKMSLMSGNSGRLVQNNSGEIYYIYFYPYLIQKFSSTGKLINSFKGYRKLDIPHQNPRTGVFESNSGIRECVVLPNDILILLVYVKNEDKVDQYFDVIDGKTGEFLGSTNCKELGLERVRLLRADFQGNIYLDFMNPSPHIKKYKISLDKN